MKEEDALAKGINLEALKEEQMKLSKLVDIKDAFDFKNATRFAAIVVETLKTKELIAGIAILDEEMKLVEDKYIIQKAKFPYIPGFRAYRELPLMLSVLEKIEEGPDVIFILGQGISHQLRLGIASHLGVSINKPTIGITQSMVNGEEKGDTVRMNGKVVAKKLQTKEKSRPIYISPGHMITLKTAVEVTKRCLKELHKLPEPIVFARKTLSRVSEEFR